MPNEWLLIDNRNRITDGYRTVRYFDASARGHTLAWQLVLDAECPPEDHPAYRKMLAYTKISNRVTNFNDYWATYGWYLVDLRQAINRFDEAQDMVVADANAPAAQTLDQQAK